MTVSPVGPGDYYYYYYYHFGDVGKLLVCMKCVVIMWNCWIDRSCVDWS